MPRGLDHIVHVVRDLVAADLNRRLAMSAHRLTAYHRRRKVAPHE